MTLTELFAVLPEGRFDPNIFKALILIGGPGSGKTTIGKNLISGTGVRPVNSDDFYEMIKRRQGQSEIDVPADIEQDPDWLRSREARRKRQKNLLDGRLGIMLDVTGRWAPSVRRDVEQLRDLGYDVAIVYVKTDVKTAIARQATRARKVKPEIIRQFHLDVGSNVAEYQALVSGNFLTIDNSGDQSVEQVINSPQNSVSAMGKPVSASKWISRWLDRPVNNSAANDWRKAQR